MFPVYRLLSTVYRFWLPFPFYRLLSTEHCIPGIPDFTNILHQYDIFTGVFVISFGRFNKNQDGRLR